jgi:hypothetical protein
MDDRVETLEAAVASKKRKPCTHRGANTNNDCCFFYPICKSNECGGQSGKGRCKLYNTGQIKIPDYKLFLEQKGLAKAALRSKRYRDSREAKEK